MTAWLDDIQTLRFAAEQFVDDWTRSNVGELAVPPTAREDQVHDDGHVKRYLSLFLAKLFDDRSEVERVRRSNPSFASAPNSLFTTIAIDRHSEPWRSVRGIALNAWMPRSSASDIGAIRIFKDYRLIDEALENQAGRLGVGKGLAGQGLWVELALRPYFALTRALSPNLQTIISFLATREASLRAHFVLGFRFDDVTASNKEGAIPVPHALLDCVARANDDTLLASFYSACATNPDAASAWYLAETLGYTASTPPDEYESTIEGVLRRRGVLEVARDLTQRIQQCIADATSGEELKVSQTMVMLTILRYFYLVTRECSHFYILPVFHTAKPAAGPRLRTLSTIGVSASSALPSSFLEGIHAAFHSLIGPLQFADYALREEARLLANQTRRYLTTIHQVKNDLGEFVKASLRYEQLLQLAQNPSAKLLLKRAGGDADEIAREAEELSQLRADIVTALEATIGHANNSNRQSPVPAELGWLSRRIQLRGEGNVTVGRVPPEAGRWLVRGIPGTVAQHLWELVMNALRIGKERVKAGTLDAFGIAVTTYPPDRRQDAHFLRIDVRDTCGGFDKHADRSGLALVESEIAGLGGHFHVTTEHGVGTTITLEYPVALEVKNGQPTSRSDS